VSIVLLMFKRWRNWKHWAYRTQDEGKLILKHHTICVGYNYAQANTNSVN